MSKKTIVLADNSYTIRRIVELSFSEEEEIELVSFENSVNLREKLMELRPAIVLVDIKLPEFNGYEVCRFINSTESLKHTHVFLLKGGFEPVDESLLKGLRFVDIITKPFDSNALVSTIKNILQQQPAAAAAPEEIPSSVPEDLPEIGGIPGATGEEISFSDIKHEIESDDIMVGGPADGPTPDLRGGSYPDEEVLPSEEITQGAQPDRDLLAPAMESPEDLENPFQEETPSHGGGMGTLTEEELNIKRNIAQQEKELEIGSLTQEELDIKKQIGERESNLFDAPVDADEINVSDEDISAMMQPPDTGTSTPPETPYGFEQPEEVSPPMPDEIPPAPAPPQPDVGEIPDLQASEVEAEMGLGPDLETSPTTRRIEMPSMDMEPEPEPEPSLADYQPPSPFDDEPAVKEEIPSYEPAEEPLPETPQVEPQVEIPPVELPSILDDLEPKEPEPVVEIPPMEIPTLHQEPEIPGFDAPKFESEIEPEPPVMEYEVPAAPSTFTETPEEPVTFERQPTAPEDMFDSLNVETEPEPSVMEYDVPATPTAPEVPAAPEIPEVPAVPVAPMVPPVEPIVPPVEPIVPPPAPMAPPVEPEPVIPTVEEEIATPAPVETVPVQMPAIDSEEILKRVEERLTVAVKEILWEIVPPLAEKIIKTEIEKIKDEVSKSFK